MKTSVELPDDLLRDLKVKAAHENRKLKDLMTELLRKGLDADSKKEKPFHRMIFPIFTGGHPAAPGEELAPDKVHEILLEQEVRWAMGKE
jgi:hypothetical protein